MGTPHPDLPAAKAALDAAKAAYEAALASRTYTQTSLDAIRVLRNQLELADYNYGLAFGSPGLIYPTPVTVPGRYPGIAPPLVSPTDISGCVLYLTSDAGVSTDGANNVLSWADQSGSGHDVVWDLGKYEYIPNVFGGMPGLFNDVQQGTLKTTTRILAPGHARTVFVVAKAHFVDANAIFVDFQPARSAGGKSLAFGINWKGFPRPIAHPASDLSTIDELYVAAGSSFADRAQVYAYRWAGSGNVVNFGLAGAALAPLSGSVLTSETGDDGMLIGHGYGATHQGPMRGSIACILVYDSQLSTDNYNRVCAWLNNKFSL